MSDYKHMRGKRLTIPTIACPGEPSCSHSTDDAEPPLIETRQILNYANFEIATALISPTHYCRTITAPVYIGMKELLIQAMSTAAVVLLNPTAERRCKSLESRLLRILAPRYPCAQSLPCPRLILRSIMIVYWIYRSVCPH